MIKVPPRPQKPSDDTLREWDKAHLWHPFTHQAEWQKSHPTIIERGEGVYVFDSEGNRYLDATSSLWCNIHGHKHPTIDAALHEQIDKIAHSTLLGITHPKAIELARRLVELAPSGLTRVFFSDDGATAVEIAIKMAFQFWRQIDSPEPGRTKFVALAGAYHGDTLGSVSVGGVERFHAMFKPLLFETLRAPIPYCYRCPLGLALPECAMACLDEVGRLLDHHKGEVAAVIVEPLVQGAAGMIVQPEGYLSRLASICKRHDVLLIADEVAVGFGRTGTLFACESEGVSPDFLCLAKGLTGGYLPMAATLTTERVHSAFVAAAGVDKTFYHGHTYTGNPLAAAAALASLEVFETERTLEKLAAKMGRLALCLSPIAGLHHVGQVRQKGLIVGIELVRDRQSKARFEPSDRVGARVCAAAKGRGVLVRPLGDVIVLMPPHAISLEQIDTLVETIYESILEVTER